MSEYIYDYEARLRRNKSLKRNKDIIERARLPHQDFEHTYQQKLRKFRQKIDQGDQGRKVKIIDDGQMQALPKCPLCGKILFINGKCPDNCRF
jgi:hypothetical protein